MQALRGAARRWMIVAAILVALLPNLAFADSGTHVVQAGETLSSIAEAHGTTAGQIMRANGLTNSNLIQVGQKLKIPTGGANSSSSGGSSSAAGTPSGRRYTVKFGDTLANIAERYGVSTRALMQANSISNPNVIAVGKTLVIPAGGKSTGGNSTGSGGGNTTPRSGSYNTYGGGPQNYLSPTRFAVSISKQHCWLIQDNDVTGSWPCSTGRRHYETPPGFYTIQSKIPVAWGSRWAFNMPYWLGLYSIGGVENGIHGLPYNEWGKDWGDEIGTPISFGCIVLQDAAAKQVYNAAYLGMQVIILK